MPCEDYEDDAILVGDAARPPVFRRLVRSVRRAVHDTYENPRDVLNQLKSVRVFGYAGSRPTSKMETKSRLPEDDHRIC